MEALVQLVLVVVLALPAATVSGVAGFGGSVILLPVLVWAYGARDAVPILTVAQLFGNVSRVWLNRRELDWHVILVLVVGSYLGKRVLGRVSEFWFARLIEAVLVVSGLQFLLIG